MGAARQCRRDDFYFVAERQVQALRPGSDDANVLSFLALAARCNVELDDLTLVEALVAIALDVREMHEHVVTLLARDETESLFCVEKLHCTLCHFYPILKMTGRRFRPVANNRTRV